jgi:hypothetical protein
MFGCSDVRDAEIPQRRKNAGFREVASFLAMTLIMKYHREEKISDGRLHCLKFAGGLMVIGLCKKM